MWLYTWEMQVTLNSIWSLTRDQNMQHSFKCKHKDYRQRVEVWLAFSQNIGISIHIAAPSLVRLSLEVQPQ